ncbi:hypothetical protein BDZ94DRAFT_837450 [Collybia nuda]|uniref:MFS general substrate transporter n=1 Tax=Collybia nuda TaxID=64659 RepID=A0A9P6CIV4_9AGAR|nr:hypothetical protein BDZ94DRAFT_837450 [Collybia nuda]
MHTPLPDNFHNPQEQQALLPRPNQNTRRHETRKALIPKFTRWGAHPFWLVPIVLVVSMSRGVTMSPRIQVYKAIACRTLNHAEEIPGLQLITSTAVDCSGPEVQARAAKIQASVVTVMSVLSAITTGFWSRLGDDYGRKPILVLFIIGALAMEFFYVLVMNPISIFGRYGEQFILVGPVLEGFVGAISSFNGIVHAYTADCTKPGSRYTTLIFSVAYWPDQNRSKIFSTVQAIVFIGLASGPWFSGFVLPKNADIHEFFYLSMTLLVITLVYLVFVCPESREPSAQVPGISSGDSATFKSHPLLVMRRYAYKFITAVMLPISMFAPRSIPGRPNKINYNITLMGLGLFLYIVSTGVYTSKYLYAQHVYEWTATQLGYYMSLLWVTRAFNLLVLLPVIVSYFKPHLEAGATTPESMASEMRFDKNLARCSLAVDGIADALVAIAPTSSQPTYLALSCLSSLTSGGNPSLHSLGAVCLHASGRGSEIGAFFGGIAVLSAVGHIISPYIFAFLYASTVAFFPKSIFCLAAVLLGCGVFLLSAIKAEPEYIGSHSYSTLDDGEEDNRA